MNLCLIATDILDTKEISLTAYQLGVLDSKIHKLPESYQKALNEAADLNTPRSDTYKRAIEQLMSDEMLVQILDLSTMTNAELVNLVAKVITGDIIIKYEVGFNADIDDLLRRFLDSAFCNGAPVYSRELRKYRDKIATEFDDSYFEIQKLRDEHSVWLTGRLYYPLIRSDFQTNYDILMWFTGHMHPEYEPDRISKKGRETIEHYLTYWLGCDPYDFAEQIALGNFTYKPKPHDEDTEPSE